MNTTIAINKDIININTFLQEQSKLENFEINQTALSDFAINIAQQFLNITDIKIDSSTSLYKIDYIKKNYNLTDIYINGHYVEVCLLFNNEPIEFPNNIIQQGIMPDLCMFISIDKNIEKATLLGFIDKENYFPNNENFLLKSFDEIANTVLLPVEDKFIDNTILYQNYEQKNCDINFINNLSQSFSARKEMLQLEKANNILNHISDNYTFNFENKNDDENLNIQKDENQEINNELENETIDVLYNKENFPPKTKKINLSFFIILLFILISTIVCFYIFKNNENNANTTNSILNNINIKNKQINKLKSNTQKTTTKELNNIEQTTIAMPNETYELSQKNQSNEEVKIEQDIPTDLKNINTSISLSNIRLDWKIPAECLTNKYTKHYFLKLGKIIQINLNNSIISSGKIPLRQSMLIELKYNKINKFFEIDSILQSSGNDDFDKIITDNIKKTLCKNFYIDMTIFENLQENPIIIIYF